MLRFFLLVPVRLFAAVGRTHCSTVCMFYVGAGKSQHLLANGAGFLFARGTRLMGPEHGQARARRLSFA